MPVPTATPDTELERRRRALIRHIINQQASAQILVDWERMKRELDNLPSAPDNSGSRPIPGVLDIYEGEATIRTSNHNRGDEQN